jgi:glycosyltransferase involved in cell wall biosynthesis
MPSEPRITVFMPVYNREQYVESAINSVLAQTFSDFELLVIDDGSTDRTPGILAGFRDPRVRVIRNDSNLGIPATRNRGLDLARGEFIAMLDSDDMAHRKRLAKQVDFLDKNPDHVLVGSWARKMDGHGKLKRVLRRPLTWERIRTRLLFMGTLRTPSVTGRLSVLSGYRFSSEFPVCSDTDYWVRIALDHRCANLPEPLIRYRKHDGGITRSNVDLTRDRKLAVIARQLDLLGVRYTEEDLAKHWYLRKGKPSGVVQPEYVDWARDWLLTLLAANQRSKIYPEPHFGDAVGERWVHLHAWDAATHRHGRVRLFDAALRAPVSAYFRGRIALRLRYGAGVA